MNLLGKANFGVFLPFYAFKSQTEPAGLFRRLQEAALESERLGYHSIWIDDHLMYHTTPLMECWTTLSALAATTKKIRLGTMVTSNAFRNPALLAKIAATVDVISGGRLEFGIGAGVQKEEHEAYGFPFPKPSLRAKQLQESLEIIHALWTREKASYAGKFYQLADAVCEPKPLQKPHPPITVGGSGEKYTLKVTAQYADRFDFGYLPTIEQYKHKLEVLQSHCQSVGRDFDEIERSCWPAGQVVLGQNHQELEEKIDRLKPKSVSREDFSQYAFLGTPDDVASLLKPYLDLGATQFMLFFADLPDTGSLWLFAEAVGLERRL